MVWVAGPVSGMIVQPIIGVIADNSRSRWGRRRPVIVVGSIIVALSLLVLGFTKEIVSHVISDKGLARAMAIFLAVLTICSVDFSINAGKELVAALSISSYHVLTGLFRSHVLRAQFGG